MLWGVVNRSTRVVRTTTNVSERFGGFVHRVSLLVFQRKQVLNKFHMLKSFSYNLGDSRGRTSDLGVLNNSAGVVAGIPDEVQVFRGSLQRQQNILNVF